MSRDEKRPLGRILLQRKLVPRELLGALTEPKESVPTSTPSPPAPTTPRAPVTPRRDEEGEALLALANATGASGLDLRQAVIVLEHLDVVPIEVAEALGILPVLLREGGLYLAMADPHDKRAIDELEFVTGKTVYPFVAVKGTLQATIAAAYAAKARGEAEYRGPMAPA